MTASESFCLSSHGFESDVKISWQELQKQNDFCDVTLACEDQQIESHKFVISSFRFKKYFGEKPEPTSTDIS